MNALLFLLPVLFAAPSYQLNDGAARLPKTITVTLDPFLGSHTSNHPNDTVGVLKEKAQDMECSLTIAPKPIIKELVSVVLTSTSYLDVEFGSVAYLDELVDNHSFVYYHCLSRDMIDFYAVEVVREHSRIKRLTLCDTVSCSRQLDMYEGGIAVYRAVDVDVVSDDVTNYYVRLSKGTYLFDPPRQSAVQ